MRWHPRHGFTLIEITIGASVALVGLALTVAAIQTASRTVAATATDAPGSRAIARSFETLEQDFGHADAFTTFVAAGGLSTRHVSDDVIQRWRDDLLTVPNRTDSAITYRIENDNLVRHEGDERDKGEVMMRNIGAIRWAGLTFQASGNNFDFVASRDLGDILCQRAVRLTFITADDEPHVALELDLPLTGLPLMPPRETTQLHDTTISRFKFGASLDTWQHRYREWHHQMALDATCAREIAEIGTVPRLINPNTKKRPPRDGLHEPGEGTKAVFREARDCIRINKLGRAIFYCLEASPLPEEKGKMRMVRFERRNLALHPENEIIPTLDGLRFFCGGINPKNPSGDPWDYQGPPEVKFQNSRATAWKRSKRVVCRDVSDARWKRREITTQTVMNQPSGNAADAITRVTVNPAQRTLELQVPTPRQGYALEGVELRVDAVDRTWRNKPRQNIVKRLRPVATNQRQAKTHCPVKVDWSTPPKDLAPSAAEDLWLYGIDCDV